MYVLELGRILKFDFKYSFYIFDKDSNVRKAEPNAMHMAYIRMYGVIQTLWFLNY